MQDGRLPPQALLLAACAGLIACACGQGGGASAGPPRPMNPGQVTAREGRAAIPGGDTVFNDVAEDAGVAHQHHKPIFEEKVKNIEPWLASVGAAAVAADYDGDGWIDLYVTDSRKGFPNVLYHNEGDGTFVDRAVQAGVARVNDTDGLSMDAVWGDYDNDGDDDLYIVKWGRNMLFRNEGDGTFTDATDKAGVGDQGNGNAAVFFDYDGDGRLDIYVGNYFREVDLWHLPTTRIMHNNFETARDGGANVLYRNNGDGTFMDVSDKEGVADTGWTLDVGVADYDSDGDVDLHVANDFGPDKLFRNEGRGGFTDVTDKSLGVDTRKGMNSEFGDFNNDGWLDLYVTNIMTKEYLKEGNMLLRNNGDGSFADIAPEAGVADGGWGWAAKFFDYDCDGDLDLYTANGFISGVPGDAYWFDLATAVTEPDFDPVDARQWPTIGDKSLSGHEKDRFFRNEGNESFVEMAGKVGLAQEGDGRGVVILDYDNDGDLDIYLVNQNQKAALFQNDLNGRRNWVAFRLNGPGDAIGARVRLTAGGLTQIREVDGGNGFSSQSDRRIHFGLGQSASVDEIEIRWPDGSVQTLRDVSANALHVIDHP